MVIIWFFAQWGTEAFGPDLAYAPIQTLLIGLALSLFVLYSVTNAVGVKTSTDSIFGNMVLKMLKKPMSFYD